MYYDELDLCLRARQRGARAMVASRIRVYHHDRREHRSRAGKRLFYLLRSRLRYARAHFSTPQTAALAVLMCTSEPILRLGRAAAGFGPDRVRDVLEAYARFAASLAGFAPEGRHSESVPEDVSSRDGIRGAAQENGAAGAMHAAAPCNSASCAPTSCGASS